MEHIYEYRTLPEATQFDDAARSIHGKAVCFSSPTMLCEIEDRQFWEVIQPNALDNCRLNDVMLRYNHDDKSQILARTRNKSLELEIKPDGLYFRASLPNTSFGNDLYELVREGLLSDMSFGFKVGKDSFDPSTCTRSIETIDYIKEISIVDQPAYRDTWVATTRDYFTAQNELLQKAAEEERRQRLVLMSML